MSKVVVILAATSAGLGLLSLHQVKQLRDGEAAIAELKTQMATLQEQAEATRTFAPPPVPVVARVFEVGSTIAPSKDPKDPPKSATAQLSPGVASMVAPPSPMSREDRMRMMREHRERQRQLMQDPEYREAMRLQTRSTLARQYPGVIEELGLDQAQADDFFAMLADQQMRANEQMEPLWEVDGEDRDPTAIQQRHQKLQQAAAEMKRNNEAELSARFGQGKLQEWKEYQSTMGQRWQLENMRSTLASQGLPLNEDVSKPMLKALAEVQKLEIQDYAAANRNVSPAQARLAANMPFEGRSMEQQIEVTKKRNQRMLDAVSSYLTFEQRQALEREQDAQVKMQEAQLRVMRARGNSNPSAGYYVEGSSGLTAVQPLQ